MRVDGPEGDVAGARVCAARTGGAETCATSGADGRATVEIPPGTYTVRATPQAGQRLKEALVTTDLTEATTVVIPMLGRAT
ncbi:MAG: hypothetical protein HYX56_04220, partial [Chloroflexi bacterium]|nr:hypothetical protein [Chloroflexota bacterium]